MRADGVVTREVAAAALKVYEVDDLGLDRLDLGVLTALVKRFGGGPVGLSTIAIAVGEEPETVEEVAEPFLFRAGLIARTPRGRVATAAGWRHLGLVPPAASLGAIAGATLFDTLDTLDLVAADKPPTPEDATAPEESRPDRRDLDDDAGDGVIA